jgi:hypothetical protein
VDRESPFGPGSLKRSYPYLNVSVTKLQARDRMATQNPYSTPAASMPTGSRNTRSRFLGRFAIAAIAIATFLFYALFHLSHWLEVIVMAREFGWDLDLVQLLIWPSTNIFTTSLAISIVCVLLLLITRKRKR